MGKRELTKDKFNATGISSQLSPLPLPPSTQPIASIEVNPILTGTGSSLSADNTSNSSTLNLRSLPVANRRLAIALARAIMDYSIPLDRHPESIESFRDVNLGEALETAISLVSELDLSTVETASILLRDGFEGSAKKLILVAATLSL